MQYPAMSYEAWRVAFPSYPKALERELMKAYKEEWAEVGARYAPGKEGKTRRPNMHRIVWAELNAEPTPRVYPKGHPLEGQQMVNGKGELLWDISELGKAESLCQMVPRYEPAHPADHYLIGGTVKGGYVAERRLPARWIEQQFAKCTPRYKWVRGVSITEAAHADLPEIERRRLRNYVTNSGTQVSGQRGRAEVFTGYEGQKAHPTDKITMQHKRVEQLEKEWLMAQGANKKRLRGMLHTARKDLEDMQYAHKMGGIMGRLHDFENHAARKTSRGKHAAEKIEKARH